MEVAGGGIGNTVGGSGSLGIRPVRAAANGYTGRITDGNQPLPTNRMNLAAYIGLEEQSGGRVVLAGAEAESGEPFVVGGGWRCRELIGVRAATGCITAGVRQVSCGRPPSGHCTAWGWTAVK